MKRYAFWNNKGGVGKTTLAYMLSTEFAETNMDCNVVVVDMCPQANISEMILGGNGEGEKNLEKCYKDSKNIAGYIKSRYDGARFSLLGSESSYFIEAKKYNSAMPENLYLLPGDCDLDLCGKLVDYMASAPEKKSWFKSRSILIDLLQSFNKAHAEKENVFFIDCNPSFSSYTELAILACDRLIIPCNADAASVRGLSNVLKIVYGRSEDNRESGAFEEFNTKSINDGFVLPKIHSVIQNRTRSRIQRAASAYNANLEKIKDVVEGYKVHKDIFLGLTEKHKDVVYNVKDGNTIAVVLNHHGKVLSSLEAKRYQIYGRRTQVDEGQKQSLIEDLTPIVASL